MFTFLFNDFGINIPLFTVKALTLSNSTFVLAFSVETVTFALLPSDDASPFIFVILLLFNSMAT